MGLVRCLCGRVPGLWLVSAPHRTFMEFSSPDRKGGYSQKPTKEQKKEIRREYLQAIPGEYKRLKNYLRERWNRQVFLESGTYQLFEDFSRVPDYVLPEWVVTVDADHKEGMSSATFERTKSGTGVFSGNLCTRVVKSGEQKRAGYASIRSPLNMVMGFDMGWYIENFNCLLIEYRGDGRNYMVNLQNMGFFDIELHDVHTYNLFTKGGPYWQTAKIPFSKLIFNYKGRIQDRQYRLRSRIRSVTISMADHKDGPFRLELRRIGFYRDNTMNETNAYEMYVASSTSKLYK